MLLNLYKTAMQASAPLLDAYLKKRARLGKEDPARANERRGQPSLPRPPGTLVWFHGASVGEAISVLAVIHRLLKDYPAIHVMVTTGTVTSAKIMAERLPKRAFHQFIPADNPAWAAGFLDHWKPDLALWIESDFWPGIMSEMKKRHIPAVLMNARISQKSFRLWRLAPGMIGAMLQTFSLCLAQNEAQAQRLRKLGAQDVRVFGNLKYAADPLPFDEAKLEILRRQTAERPLVLWSSTRIGEEEIAIRAHKALKAATPGLLTIIAPRHPKRGAEIEKLLAGAGLTCASRGQGQDPGASDDVYLADTLGELGLLFRLCRNVVMGGSFGDYGGHNPIEPAQLGCVTFFGPVRYNFPTITAELENAGAIVPVKDVRDLLQKLQDALKNPAIFDATAMRAAGFTAEKAHVVDDCAEVLAPMMQKITAATEGGGA